MSRVSCGRFHSSTRRPDLVAAIHREDRRQPSLRAGVPPPAGVRAPSPSAAPTEWRWPVPEGVREVIGRRLDRLPSSCTELLQLAAVVGRDFRVDILERASGQPGDALLDALHDAIEARLVEEVPGEPGRLRFTRAHPRRPLRGAGAWPAVPASRRHRLGAGGRVCVGSWAVSRPNLPTTSSRPVRWVTRPRLLNTRRCAGSEAVGTLAYEEAVRLFKMALHLLQESPDERRRMRSAGPPRRRVGPRWRPTSVEGHVPGCRGHRRPHRRR